MALLFNLLFCIPPNAKELTLPQQIVPFAFACDPFGNFYILDRTKSTLFKLDSTGTILQEKSVKDYYCDPIAISFFGLKIAVLNPSRNEILFFDKNLNYLSSLKLEQNYSPIDFDATPYRLFLLGLDGKYIASYSGKSIKKTMIKANYNPLNSSIKAKEKEKTFFIASDNQIMEFQFDGQIKRTFELDGTAIAFDVSEKIIAYAKTDSIVLLDRDGKKIDEIPLDARPIDIIVDKSSIYILFHNSIRIIQYANED